VEATRRIRALDGPAGRVPIVGLTANVLASERERYLAAGMDRCLTKPIAWEELFAALDEVTRDGASPPPAADAQGDGLPLLAGVAAGPPGDASLVRRGIGRWRGWSAAARG